MRLHFSEEVGNANLAFLCGESQGLWIRRDGRYVFPRVVRIYSWEINLMIVAQIQDLRPRRETPTIWRSMSAKIITVLILDKCDGINSAGWTNERIIWQVIITLSFAPDAQLRLELFLPTQMDSDGPRWSQMDQVDIFCHPVCHPHRNIHSNGRCLVRVSMDKRHLEADPLSIICFQMGHYIKTKVKFLFLLSS